MNKEIVDGFVVKMIELLNSGIDFAKSEIPDLLKQIIQYKLAVNGFYFVISMVALFATWRVHKFFAQKPNSKNTYKESNYSEYEPLGHIVVIILFLIGAIGLIEATENILQLYFAPKVYLIEYFSHLLKGAA